MDKAIVLERFFKAIQSYYPIESNTIKALEKILRIRAVPAGTRYLAAGEIPVFVAFICKGIFSYYHQFENGDTIIKKFFSENSFIASTSALILQIPGKYTIEALEDSWLAEFSFNEFKHLMQKHPDLAFFWISYLEKNWVVAKEDNEVNHKYLPAQIRYQAFVKNEPHIAARLQQQQIASYLGITPTQLSRIKKALTKK
ncbi:Crp/Fnr family transcriptional regulator [Filimonas effusa]|uniref:Crp/Fnr family transcriptional regulator n=1 Tax=Filimonas effusa TaxID=2508721 RepID=A0A4Q1D0P9_9BACT|nr:Crp/Fnr family transcriptional regulator [Filimonas effusa]RXK81324.1 Crp/Fnr family transcriptional regulator [Filimonas effusa]